MFHMISQFRRRAANEALQRTEYNEDRGSVCTAVCRRDSRLENHHFDAEYYTRVLR